MYFEKHITLYDSFRLSYLGHIGSTCSDLKILSPLVPQNEELKISLKIGNYTYYLSIVHILIQNTREFKQKNN